jgi:formamidopyrimidine-DNA glycosylase
VPELPDVERFRRFFARHAAGRTVAEVWADPSIVRNATPAALRAALRGRRFEQPERRGKWMIGWTDGPALLLHFGMTGDLVWSGEEPERHRHDRLVLELAGGDELRYRNMRKLGGAWLAHGPEEVRTILDGLGPDALALGRREIVDLLAGRRGAVKAALMDQSVMAGVGNILADEILWQARLHPRRPIPSLTEAERSAVATTLRRVLRRAVDGDDVERNRTWLSHVRGRAGATCPRCGTPLERTVVGGRTTYFCPRCQAA